MDFHCLQMCVRIYLRSEFTRLTLFHILVYHLHNSIYHRKGFNCVLSLYILKDFRNAPPAKMLFYCQNVIFQLQVNLAMSNLLISNTRHMSK